MSLKPSKETPVVLEPLYDAEGTRDFDLFLSKASISVLPVDVEQDHLARQAFRRFKFWDCFSYALAKSLAQPLLYKGHDFSQTDVPSTYADVDTLIEDVGYSPSTPIEDGIERFVKWYKDYYKAK